MKSSEARRLKELEQENARLKRLLADAELGKAILKRLLRERPELEACPSDLRLPGYRGRIVGEWADLEVCPSSLGVDLAGFRPESSERRVSSTKFRG